MPAPNLFLIYVTDMARSTRFYSDLFQIEPVFTDPGYVAYPVADGVQFALWSSRGADVTPQTPRSGEVALMVPGTSEAIDAVYAEWTAKDVTIAEDIHDEIFGRTFVIADPDGNLIRVCPFD